MRPCHIFLRREGVLGIGHLKVFLFHQCITFLNKCKLCNRWHRQRCSWSDQWPWWISWVPTFSQRYEWMEKFCTVSECIWQFQVSHWFEINFWPESCLFVFYAFKWNYGGCEKTVPVSESFFMSPKLRKRRRLRNCKKKYRVLDM